MKYKAGDKFLIEIAEVVDGKYCRVKGFNALIFDEHGLNKLERVKEPEPSKAQKPQLTVQQIDAIKGRIAEGTPWAARDKESTAVDFTDYKPCKMPFGNSFMTATMQMSDSPLYDFVKFENSPVYLPDLIEKEEE